MNEIHYFGDFSHAIPNDPCTAVFRHVGNSLVGSITLDSDPSVAFPLELDLASPTTLRNIRSDAGLLGANYLVLPAFASTDPGITTNIVSPDLSVIVLDGAPLIYTPAPGPGVETSTTFSLNLYRDIRFFGDDAEGGFEDADGAVLTDRELSLQRVNEMRNSFDHHGFLTGVERALGETNSEMLTRIDSAYGRPVGSSATGVLNAASRELGLPFNAAVEVTLNPDSPFDYISAYLEVTATDLDIYTDWVPRGEQRAGFVPTLAHRISLEGINLNRLVTLVNETGIFSATLLGDGEKAADHIAPANSRRFHTQSLAGGEVVELEYSNVLPGSLRSSVLARSVQPIANVLEEGDFHLDGDEGLLKLYSAVGSEITVGYQYHVEVLELFWSAAKVVGLSEPRNRRYIADTIPVDLYDSVDGTEEVGLLNDRGYRVIRRVLEGGRYPQFMGE